METNSNMGTAGGTTGGTTNGATGNQGVPGAAGAGTTGGNAGGGTTTTSSTDWTAGLPDEAKGYIQTKGFQNPAAVVESYRNLEKVLGAPKERLVTLPEKMDDPNVMAPIWDKLGRPQKPEEYMLKAPEKGGDEEFVKWAANTFHKEGLTRTQATKLAEQWTSFVGQRMEAHMAASNTKFEGEVKALKTEWGAAYEQNMGIGQKAAATFGLSKEQIDGMEKVMGTAATFKLFHGIGSKLGEHGFVEGGSGNNFGGKLTPQQAAHKLETLKNDTDWVRRYTNNDATAREEMERLQIFMAPQAG